MPRRVAGTGPRRYPERAVRRDVSSFEASSPSTSEARENNPTYSRLDRTGKSRSFAPTVEYLPTTRISLVRQPGPVSTPQIPDKAQVPETFRYQR